MTNETSHINAKIARATEAKSRAAHAVRTAASIGLRRKAQRRFDAMCDRICKLESELKKVSAAR